MSSEASVTVWMRELEAGNQEAAQHLWERYFERLVKLARGKLQNTPRRAADEEDVALSAFNSFCRGAEQKRFPKLEDRDDLWQLLVMLAARKAIDLRVHETRRKRGGDAVILDYDAGALEHVIGREPTPDFAAQVAEGYERLLDCLDDEELRRIAVCKMEGDTNREIAKKLGCVPRTVERRLNVIRSVWSAQTDEQ